MALRPNQKRIYDELHKRFSKEMADAFFKAIQSTASRISMNDLADALDAGDVERVVRIINLGDPALFPMAEALRTTYVAGGVSVAEIMPRAALFAFDGRNPRAEAWVSRYSSEMIQNITDDTLPMVRQVLADGVDRGRSGAAMARDIAGRLNPVTKVREGGLIGLTDQQAEAAINMRRDLEDLDNRYFTRKLRDLRYDARVRKAIDSGEALSKDDIDRITQRYRDKLLKYRGQIVARNEAHHGLSAGQHEGMQQAIDSGRVKAITKAWIHNTANQNERESHVSLGLAPAIPFNEDFVLASGAHARFAHDPQLPPSETISCRCTTRYQVIL